jgi:hypothetical protein
MAVFQHSRPLRVAAAKLAGAAISVLERGGKLSLSARNGVGDVVSGASDRVAAG